MIQLEKHVYNKFPEFNAKIYSNRRNFYIHMGLDNSLYGYSNFVSTKETWYQKNKCKDFLRDTDEHFKAMKTVNFDMIKNNVSESSINK